MSENSYPLFGIGKYRSIQLAVDAGQIRYPAWIYVRDLNAIAFIDEKLNINLIGGADSGSEVDLPIVWVDELPDAEDANEETLYVYNNAIYTFNGEEFEPVSAGYTEDVEELKATLESLTETVETMQETVDNMSETIDSMTETVENLTTTVESLEEKVEEGIEGSSLTFSSADEFPEVGEEGVLYIDSSDSDTQGIYVYDTETETYVLIASAASATDEVLFIDLDEDEVASVESADDLAAAMADSDIATVQLAADVETDAKFAVEMTAGEKTLDLNGCNLSVTAQDADTTHAAVMVTGGEITIVGDGTIDGGSDCKDNVAVWADGADSKVIISGGDYTVGNDADGAGNSTIYASNGATIEIYGGTFRGCDGGAVLNCQNATGASILCYGGSFLEQDPSFGDDSGTPGSFLADGYTVTESADSEGTWFTVVAE